MSKLLDLHLGKTQYTYIYLSIYSTYINYIYIYIFQGFKFSDEVLCMAHNDQGKVMLRTTVQNG